MYLRKLLKFKMLVAIILFSFDVIAQQPENWTKDELIEPSTLALTLRSGKNLPVLFSVGPGALIPHSIDISSVKEKENLELLKKKLKKLPVKTNIVVYCGCCPFEHCPNVRPAIQLLKDMKFVNYKLLNLPHNLKVDWLDKGYPSTESGT
jgi:hypothetical protein